MSHDSPTPHAIPAQGIWPRWLVAVLIGYTVLAVIYSVSTPIFEPPDEVFHFPLIDHIANTGRLPVQDPAIETLWHQEGSQPPLYYLLSAALVRPINRDDLALRLVRNPHARIGVGLAQDNHVTVLHDWDAEAFPWHGTALAVHVVRLFSVLLSLGTVIAIYHIARLTVPDQPAIHLTAVLLAAGNPMFLFISASVNNDTLINLLSAVTVALLLLIWRRGFSTRRIVALAVILALASISKLSGLALYPLAGLIVLLVAIRDGLPVRRLVQAGLIVIAAWAVLAGWWYARNVDLYGEPTGMDRMIEVIGPRDHAVTLGELADEFEGFRLSFWGVFGTLNVIAPDVLFDYGDALLLAPLVALALWLLTHLSQRGRTPDESPSAAGNRLKAWLNRQRDALPVGFLALHLLIVFAALVNWTRRTPATQGRLLFPALGALVTLIALGFAYLLPREVRRFVTPVVALPLVAAAIILPFHTIRPTYQPPPTVQAIPPDAIPVDARFGPIELLGVKVSDHPATPGDERGGLGITLYWRPLGTTAEDMSFYVQVLGLPDATSPTGLQEIGKIDSYPGRGLLRTTTWGLDRIYADAYHIMIDASARTPVQPKLKIGWRQFGTGMEFEPLTLGGDPRGPVIVDAGRVVGDGQTLANGDGTQAVFSGVLRLNSTHMEPLTLSPGDTLTIFLEWEALDRVHEDFTILVHLIAEPSDGASPGQPMAQGDSPPLGGRWPTSAWEPRVPFVDTHPVVIPPTTPPGTYRVAVGFYRRADFSRLPVETNQATLPGAVILPQTVIVEP